MNLDRTFCTGLRCARRETCERWENNLVRWVESQPPERKGWISLKRISVAQFADHAGHCNRYSPIEAPEPPEAA